MNRHLEMVYRAITKRKEMIVIEQEEYSFKFENTVSKYTKEIFYEENLTEKLKKFDKELFVYKEITKSEKKTIPERFYIDFPYAIDWHILLNFEMNSDCIVFNENVLGKDRYSIPTRVVLEKEKEKINQIKNAFLNNISEQNEYRLLFLTGVLKK